MTLTNIIITKLAFTHVNCKTVF